jgi:hypothetical protein
VRLSMKTPSFLLNFPKKIKCARRKRTRETPNKIVSPGEESPLFLSRSWSRGHSSR